MALCLVTGGAGFIGSHLVEALLARGDRVRILDNFSTGQRANLAQAAGQFELVEGDLRDPGPAQEAMREVDCIFHMGALVSVPQSMADPLSAEAINAAGTLNLLMAAQKAKVRRLVFSSTCAVYGDEPTLPKLESMAPTPRSPYAVAKLAGEGYCHVFNVAFGLETVVLRYFNVYGRAKTPRRLTPGDFIFVDRISRGHAPTIFGDGEQTRDFVYVSDVVQANLRAGEVPAAAGQIFNIGGGQPVTIKQLFQQLNNLLQAGLEPKYAPVRQGDIQHSYADPSQAANVLNWRAEVSLEEGLRRLVASL
ncbi:MAG: NAD-dependent epimerase/dehydratase family protein [Anaerolineae bacterium]